MVKISNIDAFRTVANTHHNPIVVPGHVKHEFNVTREAVQKNHCHGSNRMRQPMTVPLLYTYRRCPYAMRARMALLQAGVDFERFEVVLRDKPPAMLALSPKGTVPVLVFADGRVLEQSLDIMQWAFDTVEGSDPRGWWTRSQTADNQSLIASNDGPFKQQLDQYKYANRFPPGEGTRQRDAALAGQLKQLEQRLAKQHFLGGESACAADIAVFPFVRQFRAVDADWFDAQALPATHRWLQHWLSSPLFVRCMQQA